MLIIPTTIARELTAQRTTELQKEARRARALTTTAPRMQPLTDAQATLGTGWEGGPAARRRVACLPDAG